MRIVLAILIALTSGSLAKAATHYVHLFADGIPGTGGDILVGSCYCGYGVTTPQHYIPVGDDVDFGTLRIYPTLVDLRGGSPPLGVVGYVMSPTFSIFTSPTPLDQNQLVEMQMQGQLARTTEVSGTSFPPNFFDGELVPLLFTGGGYFQFFIHGGFDYFPPEAPEAVPLPAGVILFGSVVALGSFMFRRRKRHSDSALTHVVGRNGGS